MYLCRRKVPEEGTDAPELTLKDIGEEWPDFEEASLALQREFHQVCQSGLLEEGDDQLIYRRASELTLPPLCNEWHSASFTLVHKVQLRYICQSKLSS